MCSSFLSRDLRVGDARTPAHLPRLPITSAWWTACAGLVAAALVALGEIDRLIAGVVDEAGRTATVAAVVGPGALGGDARAAWEIWRSAPLREDAATLLRWHVGCDVVFAVGLAALVAGTLLAGTTTWRSPARYFLVTYLVVELVEACLLWAGAPADAGAFAQLPWVVAGFATAKWVAVLGLVIAVLRRGETRGRVLDALRRAVAGMYVQRLSLVGVVVLAVLSLSSGGGIADQLPDVQRGWLDGVGDRDWWSSRGFWHLVLAVVATVLAAGGLFVLGRQRAERAWSMAVDPTPPTAGPSFVWWLVGPVVALGHAVVLRMAVDPALVDTKPLSWFVSVPLGLVVVSAVLRWTRNHANVDPLRAATYLFGVAVIVGAAWWLGVHLPAYVVGGAVVVGLLVAAVLCRTSWTLWAEEAGTGDAVRAVTVVRTGDALALAVLLVAVLGLVRSFVAPVLLPDGPEPRWVFQVVLTAATVLVIVAPIAGWWVVRRIDCAPPADVRRTLHRLLRPDQEGWLAGDTRRVRIGRVAVPVAMALVSAAVLLALLLWPRVIGRFLGVVATTVTALACWTVLVGFLIVHLQQRRPLEVFRLLHLRASPVLTLLATVLFVAGSAGGDPDLHVIRTAAPPSTTPYDRSTLEQRFDQWYADSGACNRDVMVADGVVTARPLLLVAASGGGIRAAVWTAGVLEKISSVACGRHVTLLSSGVSGGSVGLVLGRNTEPLMAAHALAEPETLSTGAIGTLVGDLVAATTGARTPARDDRDVVGDRRWRDRAGLIEEGWENAVPSLSHPFGPDVRGAGGALILNSTSSDLSCRVVVSQIDLTPNDPTPDCRRALTGPPAGSLDLVDLWGTCPRRMTWATAAMLSARFPYVTPAGRVTPDDKSCARLPSLQLVDGGYAEGNGVGTLADIAPDVIDLVRRHNAKTAGAGPIVVPFVIYLEDETRADLETPTPGLTNEVLVPLVGLDARKLQASSGSWLQRAGDVVADPCPVGDARCAAAVRAVRGGTGGGVFVAAPLTKPAVDAPLGWSLSDISLDRLNAALDDQATKCSRPLPEPPVAPHLVPASSATQCTGMRVLGYPRLYELLEVLRTTPR